MPRVGSSAVRPTSLASPANIYLHRGFAQLRRRSAARQEKRLAALRTCKRMLETTSGGCCTPFPFEAAIWLWEETEELYGGRVCELAV